MSAPDVPAQNAGRAVAAYDAMQRHLYVGGGSLLRFRSGPSLYRETAPRTGPNEYAYVWPFSRALLGTATLAGVRRQLVGGVSYEPAVRDRLRGLEAYWDARADPPGYDSYVVSAGGGDKYHDDNAWLALALVQLHRMGLAATLDRAAQLYAFARSAWDADPDEPYPGGMFWVGQGRGQGLTNHDRGAGANAGSAALGFHLVQLTGSADYAGDGEVAARPRALGAANMVNWVQAHLDSGGAGTGLYWNAVRRDGSIDTNIWSYNQGVMVGARLLQYALTRDGGYLQQAEAVAARALATFGDFTGQPPSFNAMCFQDLLRLHAVSGDGALKARILAAMQAYGDWAWGDAEARDPGTDLFYFSDAGRPARSSGQAARLQDQGAMVQLYGLLAWDAEDYARLA